MAESIEWEEVGRKTAYSKYSQTIQRRDFRLPNGVLDEFYIRVEKAGACALALTVDNRVITVSRYRPGPKLVLRELPGGQVDPGENPRETAVRELLEETGYAGEPDDWVGTWLTDSYTDSDRTIVIVRNCAKVAEPQLEHNEFGEVVLLDVPDFVRQVRAGMLTDTAGALLALDHLGLLA